jgi:hypothetical protein
MSATLTESERISDIKVMLIRGNHLSVMKDDHLAALKNAYSKEVKHK